MGVDATRKWASEGFTREWPKRLKMSDAAAAKAAAVVSRLGIRK
jgi:4-hydroxy-3-polyprenylbenzoate decarboxylase